MRDDRIQYTRHPNLRQHVISRFKNRTNHALPNPDISLATDTARICACRNRVRVYNVFDQGLWQAPVACALAEVRPGSRRVAEKAPERTYSEEEIATRLQRDLPH